MTKDNYRECLRLDVTDVQKDFIASNAKSLAEAYVFEVMEPYVAMDGERMVGFLMLEFDEERKIGFVLRLMVDKQHQRRGYGRATMMKAIEKLGDDKRVKIIGTSHRPENTAVAHLFASLGFVPWHDIKELFDKFEEDGEVYVRLP